MNTIVLETLALDYPEQDITKSIRHIKRAIRPGGYWDGAYNGVITEYGTYDDVVLAALLYCIEQTGSLEQYVTQTKDFVKVLRRETRTLTHNLRIDGFDDDLKDVILRKKDSSTVNSDTLLAAPPINDRTGVSFLQNNLTKNQLEVCKVFSSVGFSRKETARLLGTTAVAVKQVLQRARKRLASRGYNFDTP